MSSDLRGFARRDYFSLVALAGAFLFSLLGLFLAYGRDTVTLDIGSPGDGAFLTGFYADEADIGFRYRWTGGNATVSFAGIGREPISEVTVYAQGPRPSDVQRPITMSILASGVQYFPATDKTSLVVTLTDRLEPYRFVPFESSGRSLPAAPQISIVSGTFQPSGDARTLGVKVDRVSISRGSGFRLPSGWLVVCSLAWVTGFAGLATGRRSWVRVLAPLLGAALCVLAVLLLTVPYIATYFPPFGAAAGLLGLLVWQRARVLRWPEGVDSLGGMRLASALMLAAMLVYAAFALWVIPQVDWIGHADYAENAVIARNLVSGKGLTVDYVAQFYRDYGPGLSHPADTWPLLQPLMIAPFFAVLGAQTWVAKLPNLFVLLGLAWVVFALSRRIWDARVGLFAAVLTLLHPYFFNSVLYPINDLAFTLIFFCLAWAVWRLLPPEGDEMRSLPVRDLLLTGALAGLLVWSKPSGATLLVGLAAWALLAWKRSGHAVPWRGLAYAAGAAFVMLLPLFVRNLLAFGAPFYSTEGTDAWVLRYWPLHDWEDIYKYYIGSSDPPHPRWIVGGKFGYQNLFDAIGYSFRWLWQKGVLGAPGQGDYVMGMLPLSGALVGAGALGRRARGLLGMVGLSITLYGLFVLLYWHFEGRYFQVAVPWLYMLLAWGVFWLWDRLRGSIVEGLATRLGLIVLPVAVAAFLWPSIEAIGEQVQSDTASTGFVTAMQWLKANSAPSDVVMTRDPWELNWYTGLKAVMIPNDNLPVIERTMRQYGATMLQLGGPVDGIDVRRCPSTMGSRPALGTLYCGEPRGGFSLVYREGGLTIYRLTPAR